MYKLSDIKVTLLNPEGFRSEQSLNRKKGDI